MEVINVEILTLKTQLLQNVCNLRRAIIRGASDKELLMLSKTVTSAEDALTLIYEKELWRYL